MNGILNFHDEQHEESLSGENPPEEARASSAPPVNPEIFQREAVRMKLPGTRRGTTVALAGVLQGFAESGGGQKAAVPDRPRSVEEQVFDFAHVTQDPATRALIDTGRTMGCFYIESPGMRALFERLRCRTYEEVVAASSIIRPGVAESGMMQEYVARHMEQNRPPGECASPPGTRNVPAADSTQLPANGKLRVREITVPPVMLRVLPETYGVMVYQEDVLRVAHEVAGLSYAEADLLRRAMSGKGRSEESMRRLEQSFLKGARERGHSDADTREIWRQMSSFAGYSFCKGHSAAFAVLSYQITWLKAHYPGEFFAALLTNQGGFYGPGAYLEEARRWGIEVLGPCINASEEDYTGCTTDVHPEGAGRKGWLRVGLGAVLGLSSRSRQKLLRTREAGGPYRSLNDFLERSGIGGEECRSLIKAGALDCLDQAPPEKEVWRNAARLRPALLLELAALLRQRDLVSGSFFEPLTFSLWKAPKERTSGGSSALPRLPDAWTRGELCTIEVEHLGFPLSAHPLELVRVPDDVVGARDIRAHDGKRIRMAGLAIAAKLLETRNSGRMMKMLTLEDRTDTFEAVLFPRVYARYAPRTLTRGPYLLEGRVDMSLGSPTLNVERISVLT